MNCGVSSRIFVGRPFQGRQGGAESPALQILLAALLVLSLAAPASAAWRRVDSPNFIVVGDVSARELRATAARFEGFHEALRRVLPSATTSAPVPTVVIVFPNDAAFTPYKPQYRGKPREGVAGFAAAGLDVNYIAMLNIGEFNERVIFHEYTHMILANAVARVPVWLNEGLAEFYSTFALMDGGKRAQIGRPIPEHLQRLNGSLRVPLAELLKVDSASPLYNEGNRVSDFYAESWALTHMLLNGQPSRIDALADYLRRVNDGAGEMQAWEQAFGTAKTENDLRRYLMKPTYTTVLFDFAERVAALPVTETVLSATDTAAFLAALQLRNLGTEAATRILEPALSGQPVSLLAQATMAQIEVARQDPAGARKRLAGLEATSDWFAAYWAGFTLTEATERQQDPDGVKPALVKATEWLQAVRRERPDLPNALALLARVELAGDETPSAAARDNIARARALAPGRIDYALTHAELLADAREFAAARSVIGPLMTSSYPEGVRNSARRLMAGLVELERAVPRSTAGQGRFIPVYRQLQAHEQRTEGVLERIDCPPGAAVRFMVRDAAGLSALSVARMADVDFISYREDLTGGVSCGPLKEPMRVYVTWRTAAAPAGEKVVVAVEFLPKNHGSGKP